MDSSELEDPIASYQGSVLVRWRIRSYHTKGTRGGQMSVYADRLIFQGVGIHRWELATYEISQAEIDKVHPLQPSGITRFLWIFPHRQYGIFIVSKPGGSFKDRDEYTFRFDVPEPAELLATMRAAGYPIG
jgi:hypothetical protein